MSVDQDPHIRSWRKSSYSGHEGACVEIADSVSGAVRVRDSKAPEGPALTFPSAAWRVFISVAWNGRLSRMVPTRPGHHCR
ncbi:DUF397 domain-containing protein [Streptomyces sp. NPDC056987]|uniref:DUF397 domain-containing protein n=1 Tax=Streptomyces sp. NPDC056987 TaxID=3345988 RepID=UPI00363F4D53